MKHCIKCEYHTRAPVQVGPNANQVVMMGVCKNEECSDPVTGDPLPCELVRREVVFCGITGKHFKAKEVREEPKDGNVIQLA